MITRPHQIEVFTDSSKKGWGAHMLTYTAQGRWDLKQQKLHINVLEMLAVLKALETWETKLLETRILIATDNTTVLAYLNNQGGTHSYLLNSIALQILFKVDSLKSTLRARHVAGEKNVLADLLSRQGEAISTEWRLKPSLFRILVKRWGNPHIDLFATSLNTQLPLYYSPVPDPRSLGVDSLSQTWGGGGKLYCTHFLRPP